MILITALNLGVLALSGLLVTAQVEDQSGTDTPPECRSETVDWNACAQAAQGTLLELLAYANLGTQAFMAGDIETAIQHYDRSTPAAGEGIFDAFLHAHRASAFFKAGRTQDAVQDAQRAVSWLNSDTPGYNFGPWEPEMRRYVLEHILPVIYANDMPDTDAFIDEYLSYPMQSWVDLTNAASVMLEMDRLDEALALSSQAVSAQPQQADVLNNHCYILTTRGQYHEAAGYCERAVMAWPDQPAFRHSYAEALAGGGRCEEAQEQLAEARRLAPSVVLYSEPLACTP